MLRSGRLRILVLLFLTAVLLAAGLLRSANLLEDHLRPRLVDWAASALGAEVRIARLDWQRGALEAEGLWLDQPGFYRLEIHRLRLELRLRDLWQRRLTALEITSPVLRFEARSESPSTEPGRLPARLPLTVNRLILRDGRVEAKSGHGMVLLRELEADLFFDDRYRFALRALLGQEDALALHLDGEALWRDGLQLTLKRFDWDETPLLAEELTLLLAPDASWTGGGRLRLARWDRQDYEALRRGLDLPQLVPDEWDFRLRDLELELRWNAPQDAHLQLRLAALELWREGLVIPVAGLAAVVEPAAEGWRVRATASLADGVTVTCDGLWQGGIRQATLRAEVPDPGRLKARLLGGTAPPLNGGLQLNADFRHAPEGPRVHLELRGRSGHRSGPRALLNLHAVRLQAELELGEVLAGEGRLWVGGQHLASFRGVPERLEMELHPAHSASWSPLPGPALRFQPMPRGHGLSGHLSASRGPRGLWDLGGTLQGEHLQWEALHLDAATTELALRQTASGAWSGSVNLKAGQLAYEELALADFSADTRLHAEAGQLLLQELRGAGRLAGSDLLAGSLQLDGSGFYRDGAWQLDLAALQLADLEWIAADGTAGVAGGRVLVQGQLTGFGAETAQGQVRAELAAEEGLWGLYYADLGGLPLELEGLLRWRSARREMEIASLLLRLEPFGTLQGRGRLVEGEGHFDGTLVLPELSGAASERLASLLAENRPELAGMRLGGSLQTDFHWTRRAFWHLKGGITLRELAMELPAARLSLQGLSGTLPFHLSDAAAPAVEALTAAGRLAVKDLQLGPVRWSAASVGLNSAPNRIELQDDLQLELAGGLVTVGGLRFGATAGESFAAGHLVLEGVDLQRLTTELGVQPMRGALNADLGRIDYRGGRLRSEGQALIEAFDGRIRVDGIGLDLSSLIYPLFTADIVFEGIDLHQLTQTLAFGDMNGIVDGYIRNLRLLGTTPSRFNARLETRPGGKRDISVRALNNLAILSQGGVSSALSRGIYRFIDYYRYRRIGILFTLDRDLFQLKGTAREGTDRFLVDGGILPPKIDIIAPPSAISFSEMLRRLQRMERAN